MAVQVEGATPLPVPLAGTLALLVPETPPDAAVGVTLMLSEAVPPAGMPPALVTVQVSNCPAASVPEATHEGTGQPAAGRRTVELDIGGATGPAA